MSQTENNKKGFTLIEMMVSLAIFSVVAVIAAGALLRIVDSNRKAQSIQSAMSNLNFALESMTRELRQGTKYYCNSGDGTGIDGYNLAKGSCSQSNNAGGSYLAFRSWQSSLSSCSTPFNLANVYRFVALGTTPQTYEMDLAIQSPACTHPSIGSGDFYPIVSKNNVVITGYNISVSSDNYPLASIRISGYTGVREKDRSYFTIQTAAASSFP